MADSSALSGLYGYLRNSFDGLARGAKAAREFTDSITPGPQTVAQFLPGAGFVQGAQDARNARASFNEGRYGQAFGDAVASVVNTGLEAIPGGSVAAGLGKMAPAILAGIGAKTFNPARLRVAEDLERAGMSPSDLWRMTGMERGADTLWRHEIPDQSAKFNEAALNDFRERYVPTRFGDLLNHPELMAAYPQLADLPVVPQPGTGGVYRGYNMGVGVDDTPREMLLTMLHEGQHGVQGVEGFASGGNPDFWAKTYQDILRGRGQPAASREDAYKRGFEAYQRTAGEVEARNVETRYGMPQNMLTMPPQMTEGVQYPRSKQIMPPYDAIPPGPRHENVDPKDRPWSASVTQGPNQMPGVRMGGEPSVPANVNTSQQQVREMLPDPLSRMDRDWQNYGQYMGPDDVMASEPVWGAAALGAENGSGRAEAFAAAANDFWRRMGANRFITPELARRYMAVEEAKMRGVSGVPAFGDIVGEPR